MQKGKAHIVVGVVLGLSLGVWFWLYYDNFYLGLGMGIPAATAFGLIRWKMQSLDIEELLKPRPEDFKDKES